MTTEELYDKLKLIQNTKRQENSSLFPLHSSLIRKP